MFCAYTHFSSSLVVSNTSRALLSVASEMGRRPSGPPGAGRRTFWILVAAVLFSSLLVCTILSTSLRQPALADSGTRAADGAGGDDKEVETEECCRGMERMELWGAAVKWGTDHRLNSSRECCRACKAMCGVGGGPCLCNSWVFCGDRDRCGEKYGECWLKKQEDVLFPVIQESGKNVIWTSGLVYGKGKGIIGLETDYGILHIKLFPDCAPHSVAYILELIKLRHCAGCQIYRAEGRGHSWNAKGDHLEDASFGPPYALIQGTLEADGISFTDIPVEACPTVRRGSVAWIDSGPEFFISLVNHYEWRKAYTVFGSVLPEDMDIAEKIAGLPTKSDVWNNIDVLVLEKPINLKFKRNTTAASL